MINKKILFIGTGYMGETILKGVISKKVAPIENIIVCNRSEEKSKYIENTYGVKIISSIADGINQADIAIIATKPQDIDVVLENIKNNKHSKCLIVSVAAGIKIKRKASFFIQRKTCILCRNYYRRAPCA